MSDYEREMHDIRQSAEAGMMAQQAASERTEEQTKQLKQAVVPLLKRIAKALAEGDKRLSIQSPTDGSVGFILSLTTKTAGVTTPFLVTAQCTDTDVTLTVTDGKWEEVGGVMGNWAHWTDQREVYKGPLNEGHIERTLRKAFLPWYESMTKASAAARQ